MKFPGLYWTSLRRAYEHDEAEPGAPVPYDFSSVRGTIVWLRFHLKDADLFALRTGD